MSRTPRGWLSGPVLTAAALSAMAGFAQFGPAAALADISTAFGDPSLEPDRVTELALPGSVVGLGLAIIRLASLGSLTLAGFADRAGRRRVLLVSTGLGLVLTGLSALAGSYWWFVAIFALGRPFLSATNAVAGVTAAEHVPTRDRAGAIAVIAAGYGLGTGVTLLVRDLAGDVLGFRGLFASAALLVLLLPLAARALREPTVFASARRSTPATRWRLGAVPRPLVPRLVLLGALTFGIGFVTGPANTYVFLFGEQVVGLPLRTLTLAGLSAGPIGLLGLLAGRWAADRLGRRPSCMLGMALAGCGAIVLYSGTATAVVVGYLLSLLGQSAYGPPAGAMDAELFPTRVRATVAGWLTVAGVLGASSGLALFGALWEAIGPQPAALTLFVPIVVLAGAYWLLPETRDRELPDDVETTASPTSPGTPTSPTSPGSPTSPTSPTSADSAGSATP
ncbi:MFS transporter [Egibacter rhizosphaerae]|uniref:MFS transporter n=1 Tax=Egibacter rhizosphaerae TaxID=1670831 RepID=A0A411YAG8_9ACTN|nr:MFS transporter [Egibacter rhizosphaerae]QBI18213.1 MFS transporter [Egibacter rhizosphaerae]